MDVFMNVAGKKYLAELPASAGDCKLPICTFELREILRIAGKPLSDEEIDFCKVAIATTVYPQNDGDSNASA